jgi:hypothetical protein
MNAEGSIAEGCWATVVIGATNDEGTDVDGVETADREAVSIGSMNAEGSIVADGGCWGAVVIGTTNDEGSGVATRTGVADRDAISIGSMNAEGSIVGGC